MSFDSDDRQRMEYQRYLEKSGVVETITKVLAALYELPEKPLDANEFIRDFLSVSAPDDVDRLRKTLTALQARLNQLDIDVETIRSENEFLRRKIAKIDGVSPSPNQAPTQQSPSQTSSTLLKQNSVSMTEPDLAGEQKTSLHFKITQQDE